MKIKAKSIKTLCIRYAEKNLEYCFTANRETSYTFNKQVIYDYVLNELKAYKEKGIVDILYPKQKQDNLTQSIQELKPKPKSKSKSKKEA